MKESLLTLMFCVPLHCYGQETQKDIDFSRLTDDLVGLQDDDSDYESAYENLAQLLANPINLNVATSEDLRQLHLLNEGQIQEFITHRNTHGKLLNIYELQAIPGFDLHSIHSILPFVNVPDPSQSINASLLQRILKGKNNYFITRIERTLESKKGFSTDDRERKFKGSEDKIYIRFRNSKPGDFSFGFTAEKDAGEQLQWNPSQRYYGTDFYSYHAQLMNKGRIKNLVMGDFQCQFGQGLILGSAFGLGKGAESISTTRRSSVGILPFTSANESGFYRGIGSTYQIHPNFLLTAFYSSARRDASIQEDESNNIGISSFQSTGLHRNTGEFINRKKIIENSHGFVLNYQNESFDGGLIFHSIGFSEHVYKSPSLYNQFAFEGNQNTNLGAYVNYRINNLNFFSEGAKSLGGGTALLTGVMGSVHRNLDIALVYRKFARNFYSFYGNPFSENTSPQNESAFYWGWKYAWNRKYSASGYVDLFRFPWLAFRRYAPSSGHEWLLRFNYQPTRKILLFIQMREESKARNQASENNLYLVSQGTKRNYWININCTVSEKLKLKTRAQYSTFSIQGKTTEGLALLQDLSFSIGKFQFTARHAIFDTDDFDNRQYVYENDVWLAFSLPAYYGNGLRNYLLVEYKVNKALSVWIRYARTRFTDRDELGSGLDAISGNTKNDVKFQMLLRF